MRFGGCPCTDSGTETPKMIRGKLETLYALGFIEGWAYDAESPARPLLVEVRDSSGGAAALGYADRYREALARDGHAGGWCAFRLRVARADALREGEVGLFDAQSGERIATTSDIAYVEKFSPRFETGEQNFTFDPFVIDRVDKLAGLSAVFDAYVAAEGVDAFVRAAYVYTLGRPPDPEGAALYGRMLGKRSMTPYELVEKLTRSGEFRQNPRPLAAPKSAAFPFFEAPDAR